MLMLKSTKILPFDKETIDNLIEEIKASQECQRKLAEELTVLFIRRRTGKRLKPPFFGNAADDLKELDEATFRSFDGVPQAKFQEAKSRRS
jgi:hypothetical protein